MEVGVAIVGAGPAGSALAAGLAKKGFRNVHLFEGRSRLHVREGIFEDPTASRSKEITGGESWSFGLSERTQRYLSALVDPETMQLLRQGAIKSPQRTLWRGESAYPRPTNGHVTVRRTLLVEVIVHYLEKQQQERVTIHFEWKLKAAEYKDNKYLLTFDTPEGEKQVVASEVIGCDGIHSPVRRFLIEPLSQQTPRPAQRLVMDEKTTSKWVIFPGFVEISYQHNYSVAGRKGSVVGTPEVDGSMKWTLFLGPDATAEDGIDPQVWLTPVAQPTPEQIAGVRRFFRTYFPIVSRCLDLADDERVAGYLRKPPNTLRASFCTRSAVGRVVLLGDAAHAPIPSTGAGVQSAIADVPALINQWEPDMEGLAVEQLFEKFDREHVQTNDFVLFRFSTLISEQRWSWWYTPFINLYGHGFHWQLKAHSYLPWLVAKPFSLQLTNGPGSYSEAWASLQRQLLLIRSIPFTVASAVTAAAAFLITKHLEKQ